MLQSRARRGVPREGVLHDVRQGPRGEAKAQASQAGEVGHAVAEHLGDAQRPKRERVRARIVRAARVQNASGLRAACAQRVCRGRTACAPRARCVRAVCA